MQSQSSATRMQNTTVEMQLLHPAGAWIRSNRPVKTPRGTTDRATDILSAALSRGIIAECDLKRRGFFEATIGNLWFYFHLFDGSECVYLVASR